MKTFKLDTFEARLSQKSAVNQFDYEISGLEKITANTHMILVVKDRRQADMFNRAIAAVYFAAVAFTLTTENFNSALNKILASLKQIKLDLNLIPLVLMVYDKGDGDTPLERKFLSEMEQAGYQSNYDWYSDSFDELLFEGGKDNLIFEMHRLYQKNFKC